MHINNVKDIDMDRGDHGERINDKTTYTIQQQQKKYLKRRTT